MNFSKYTSCLIYVNWAIPILYIRDVIDTDLLPKLRSEQPKYIEQ